MKRQAHGSQVLQFNFCTKAKLKQFFGRYRWPHRCNRARKIFQQLFRLVQVSFMCRVLWPDQIFRSDIHHWAYH
jgi:hypothetical protein